MHRSRQNSSLFVRLSNSQHRLLIMAPNKVGLVALKPREADEKKSPKHHAYILAYDKYDMKMDNYVTSKEKAKSKAKNEKKNANVFRKRQ